MIPVPASGWAVVALLALTPRARLRKPEQPVHVFLQGGTNDPGWEWGTWTPANFETAAALRLKGYGCKYVLGDGAHGRVHGETILSDSLG